MVEEGVQKPVTCRPRHLNQMADAMTNEALDTGQSFQRWRQPLDRRPGLEGLNVVSFVDGGVRHKVKKGAAGWYAVAIEGEQWWRIMDGAVFFGGSVLSSYLAEAVAFEEGVARPTTG